MLNDDVADLLQNPILEELGQQIVDGVIAPGDRLTLDSLQARFGVSRTVMRDCMRVLESLRMVISRRRVGLVVQPPESWNKFDRRVIRWRLSGPGREDQFAELTELRIAVEPLSAARAAARATAVARDRLQELAGELRRLGEAGELEEFLAADIEFHQLLLRSSGNSMFAQLDGVIAEVLTGRTHQGLMPFHPRPEALAEHEAVADAVARRDSHAAERHMQVLVDEVRRALDSPNPAQ
ncbi:FadR/GntR family transcriptional regulator [Zhihengliuella flava]|uniref:DNA-binding FadR family transcriptional regulator n=1 Tax=Zhihengliuella flava TaxID=1285193 RepID=A0A931GF17_9MICC|nr:FCD domain-containing protein [Zhihengliuella flava]MBG6084740.1 DNA-binding FadR family transcriptional regulator [Zhihengliuella flava]